MRTLKLRPLLPSLVAGAVLCSFNPAPIPVPVECNSRVHFRVKPGSGGLWTFTPLADSGIECLKDCIPPDPPHCSANGQVQHNPSLLVFPYALTTDCFTATAWSPPGFNPATCEVILACSSCTNVWPTLPATPW